MENQTQSGAALLQPRLVRLLQRHLFRAEEDYRTKMLGYESSERLKSLIAETKAAIAETQIKTEESYHSEPPEGCICGFMAQVTVPGCPVCQPNAEPIHGEKDA